MKSNAIARPTHDGVGIGVERHFVLPNFTTIKHGYVRGSPSDPSGESTGSGIRKEEISVGGHGGVGVGGTEAGAGASATTTAATSAQPNVAASKISGSSDKRSGKKQGNAVGRRDKRPRKNGESGVDVGVAEDDAPSGIEDADEQSESSISSSSSDSAESESAMRGAGEYVSKKGSREGAGGAVVPRARSARAATAGVSLLTAQLRREGVLAEGDEDEEGGGDVREDLKVTRADGSRAYVGGAGGAAQTGTFGGVHPQADAVDAQSLTLSTERFSIPELLFFPVDVGLNQEGLPGAIAAAIEAGVPSARAAHWSSIVLVGGGARLPGLETRLAAELRARAPAGVGVRLFTPAEPELMAWRGASAIAARPDFSKFLVTKAMWKEEGPVRCTVRLNAAAQALGGGVPGSGPADALLDDD